MQESTNSPSPRRGDQERTHKFIAVVFAVGISLFGYGFAVTVGLLPTGWGIIGVFQYILLILGALLASLMVLVIVWFCRQDSPQSLARRQAILASLVASMMAFVAAIVSHWLRVGDFSLPQFLDWTALGLIILSLQFPLGTVKLKRQRRLLLMTESIFIFAFIFGFLIIDRGDIHLASYLLISGSAPALLLLFGGPLYLLGNHLNRLSR